MKRWVSIFTNGILFGGAFLTIPLRGQADLPQQSEVAGIRKPFERFDGKISVRTKGGESKDVRVVVRTWIIENRQQIPRFPENGFMIVQLRAGQLTTVVDGKRQERRTDEFWTMPEGSSMSIETGDDLAIVQTVAVKNLN